MKNYDFAGRLYGSYGYDQRSQFIQKFKDWPFRARLIVKHVSARPDIVPDSVIMVVSDGRNGIRVTEDYLDKPGSSNQITYEEKHNHFKYFKIVNEREICIEEYTDVFRTGFDITDYGAMITSYTKWDN